MGFLRRIAIIFGFLKYAGEHEGKAGPAGSSVTRRPTQGFGLQVPAASKKPSAGPIVVPCSFGEGGVQGFSWYCRQLRVDDDGDVADEFLDEVLSPMSFGEQDQAAHSRFEVKYATKPALIKRQAITVNGDVHPCMEYHGMLRWV
ncbi:hypothetical protein KFK09_019071 [Dendrobium nobile]|uniref:Uncharacterized protein n=1 Tax=Dendrobium nobile TaxID=94219 RepID=A0A8T3AWI5_DENNO|nr:hypothetical protein KFK09_019071 [Dendrobium nobile]